MAHRTQITLDDRQYDRLRDESARTGASLSELIRRAVDDKYGTPPSVAEKLAAVRRTAGIWSDEA
jgi:hypothetical protein